MKKILLMLTMITTVYTSFGQGTEKSIPTVGGGTPDCPAGWCSYWQYTFTTFNFHKPKTDCKGGFGLCIKGTSSTGCRPCNTLKNGESLAKIENGKVVCYGEFKNGKLEFHVPAGIKTDQNLSAKDVTTFTLEKGTLSIVSNGKELFNKEGSYAVNLSGDEYVITVDLE